MNILGLWDGHDSGAAILRRGRLVAAVNEERLSRRKLEFRFPSGSIRSCLEIAGIGAEEIDCVACSTTDFAKTLGRWVPWIKESYYRLRRRQVDPGPGYRWRKAFKYWLTEFGPVPGCALASAVALRGPLRRLGLQGSPLHFHDHHRCHGATAAWASGWESCLVITVDGVGDGLSATVSRFEDLTLRRIAATKARNSVGIFFEHVTNLLGMRELEDEGKVMALADYCLPIPDECNPLVELLMTNGLRFRTAKPGHALQAPLARSLWRYDREQFSYLAQRSLELAVLQLVRQGVVETGLSRVALAGGVASNVKLNRLIRKLPEVDQVFVFPHMGDGGLALGAALLSTVEAGQLPKRPLLPEALALGPRFSEDEMACALKETDLSFQRVPDLVAKVATLLGGDRVVFWFQDRMEYGPRALGKRSVLARPDRPEIRDRLNLALKRRAWYQPFCPSILQTEAERIFEDYTQPPDRFMTMAYIVRPEARERMRGVISRDGSCRPQIVADDSQDPFAELLREVKTRLGVGAVLNTSFNIHGEPLVCSPRDAVSVFRRSGGDALALGPFLGEREP